jgi:hypothetical protein
LEQNILYRNPGEVGNFFCCPGFIEIALLPPKGEAYLKKGANNEFEIKK